VSDDVETVQESEDVDPLNLAIWGGKRVSVWDSTFAPWRPHVAAMVEHFNVLGVPRMPRLEYVPMREAAFSDLTRRELGRRGILVAVAPPERLDGVAEVFYDLASGERLLRARVLLSAARPPEQAPLCHEFMHALTMMDDQRDRPLKDASCIWGYLRVPGEFDRRDLRAIYRQLQDR
jgi:hypothetical protein